MPIEDRIYPLLKHYAAAPQAVKSLLGAAYVRLPVRWRLGPHYARFVDDIAASADLQQLRERADTKLREALNWAVRTVPAYADMSDRVDRGRSAVDCLQAFPLLTKERVKAETPALLSRDVPARDRLPMHTGGSTSIPMRLYLHKHVSRAKDLAYNGSFDRIAGVGPLDIILALRGRMVPGADRPGARRWMFDPIKRYLTLSANHLEWHHLADHMEVLRSVKPTFVHAYPSALEPLARWLEQNPVPEVTGRVRAVQLFSETVYDYQIDLFERVFRCPVLLDYGHSERAVKAISMPGDRRYFFWPLYGHVELIGLDGKAVTEPGVLGEIVATGFDNKVMPLIRYRTGDLAMWSAQPNTTRPGFQVVERIEGRLQEFLVCADGRLVSIASMCAAHFEVLVNAHGMQFEQSAPGKAVLKITSAEALSERVRTVLVEGIRDKTHGGLEVEPVRVDEIERTASGKHRMLIQNIPFAHNTDAVPGELSSAR